MVGLWDIDKPLADFAATFVSLGFRLTGAAYLILFSWRNRTGPNQQQQNQQ
jgi:hypothetical protein